MLKRFAGCLDELNPSGESLAYHDGRILTAPATRLFTCMKIWSDSVKNRLMPIIGEGAKDAQMWGSRCHGQKNIRHTESCFCSQKETRKWECLLSCKDIVSEVSRLLEVHEAG